MKRIKKLLCKLINISYDDYLWLQKINDTEKTIVLKQYSYQDYNIIKNLVDRMENVIEHGYDEKVKIDTAYSILARIKMLIA